MLKKYTIFGPIIIALFGGLCYSSPALAQALLNNIEIYHNMEARTKFVAIDETSGDDVSSLFTRNKTASAQLANIITTRFVPSEHARDSAIETQEEFNLYIDNSELSNLLTIVINENPHINQIKYNYYQKLTISSHSSVPSNNRAVTTLKAHYGILLKNGKSPVFLDGKIRATSPLILYAYYISPNNGLGKIPIKKRPPGGEDTMILGLRDMNNQKVPFIPGTRIYKITVNNLGFLDYPGKNINSDHGSKLNAHNNYTGEMLSNQNPAKCMLGHATNPSSPDREILLLDYSRYDENYKISTHVAGNAVKYDFIWEDKPTNYETKELYRDNFFGNFNSRRSIFKPSDRVNDIYATGNIVFNDSWSQKLMDNSYGGDYKFYDQLYNKSISTLYADTRRECFGTDWLGRPERSNCPNIPFDDLRGKVVVTPRYSSGRYFNDARGPNAIAEPNALKPVKFRCVRDGNLSAIIHDAVNVHVYDPKTEGGNYKINTKLGGLRGKLPVFNRVEKIIFASTGNYRHGSGGNSAPNHEVIKNVYNRFCKHGNIETTYKVHPPSLMVADISYYDIDPKEIYTSRRGERKVFPNEQPLSERFMFTRTLNRNQLTAIENYYIGDLLGNLFASYENEKPIHKVFKRDIVTEFDSGPPDDSFFPVVYNTEYVIDYIDNTKDVDFYLNTLSLEDPHKNTIITLKFSESPQYDAYFTRGADVTLGYSLTIEPGTVNYNYGRSPLFTYRNRGGLFRSKRKQSVLYRHKGCVCVAPYKKENNVCVFDTPAYIHSSKIFNKGKHIKK